MKQNTNFCPDCGADMRGGVYIDDDPVICAECRDTGHIINGYLTCALCGDRRIYGSKPG